MGKKEAGRKHLTEGTRADNLKQNSNERTSSKDSKAEDKPRDSYRRHPKSSNGEGRSIQRRDDNNSNRNTSDSRKSVAASKKKLETSPNVTIDESFYKQKEDKKRRYRTRKCIIVHDPYFDQFDKGKFSKWYDIETMRYDTLLSAASDKSLLTKIQKICPEVVYLHVGDCMRRFAQDILASTNAKLCISLIIPLSNHVPQVQSIIRQVNREIADMVSDLRKNTKGEAKIFTQNNDSLRGFIQRSTGQHGITVSLNERGQRKLWLHLKDALKRILDDTSRRDSTRGINNSNSGPQRSQSDHE